jgi:hypothetical protein
LDYMSGFITYFVGTLPYSLLFGADILLVGWVSLIIYASFYRGFSVLLFCDPFIVIAECFGGFSLFPSLSYSLLFVYVFSLVSTSLLIIEEFC